MDHGYRRMSLRTLARTSLVPTMAGLLFGGPAGPLSAQEDVDYQRAEMLLGAHASRMVVGNEVDPNWLSDGNRFWYRVTTHGGANFILVDPVQGVRQPVFDNHRLAAAMSLAADTTFTGGKLPFTSFEFDGGDSLIRIRTAGRLFRCDVQAYDCSASEAPEELSREFVVSPDSTLQAFIHQHDLWIRSHPEGTDSVRLTDDGEEFYSYGISAPRPGQLRGGEPQAPQLRWSPDSRKILVYRVDERGVGHMPIYSSTSQRPQGYTYPYPLPGDSVVPLPTLHVIDVEAGGNLRLEVAPRPNQLSISGSPLDSVWTQDSRFVHFGFLTRGSKSNYVVRANASTGESRIVASDTSSTFVDWGLQGPASWHITDDAQDVIWWSQRDGWSHLWRLDLDGEVKNQITRGAWAASTVLHVDQANGQVYFLGRGREEGRVPFYRHLYRVGFDGSGLELLTPEDGDHAVSFSPSGRFFVDTHSRIEEKPITRLRRADGTLVMELEEADISRLALNGWTPPRVFSAKGRDGVTDIWGVMFLPSHLDESRKYPIISHIYPGPQRGSVESWTFKDGDQRGEPHALAELGFVVVQIDHMGSPHRSKAFHDVYYGNMGDNGLPDHMAVMKELAARHSFIDLDRVGIYGHSGGGFASTDAILRYPDFFHVAVSTAGNHDNRSYNIYWAEKYQGLLERDTLRGTDSFENQANSLVAENLRGKLLLIHGDMDDNVHPASTLQVANALIAANKDFDLLMVPDRAHGLDEPYVIRRRWDYFVRHLLGKEPPREYHFRLPTD